MIMWKYWCGNSGKNNLFIVLYRTNDYKEKTNRIENSYINFECKLCKLQLCENLYKFFSWENNFLKFIYITDIFF